MAPKKKSAAPPTTPALEFLVKFDALASADLERIDDRAAVTAILQQALQLKIEPLKQGKSLKKAPKGYRSVPVTGQPYQIVYHVHKQVVIIAVSMNIDDSGGIYVITENELG